MNNKHLGLLNTLLFSPEKGEGPGIGGDIYSQIDAAAAGAPGADDTSAGAPAEGADKGTPIPGAADEGAGEGAEDTDFSDKGAEGAEAGAEGAEEGTEGADKDGKGDKAAPMLKLDPETIAQLREGLQPKGAEAEKGEQQFTAAQIKEMLNPVEVTDDLVTAIRHEDPQVAKKALQNFANATVKNAHSIAKVMIQREAARFEEAMGPLFAQQQKASLDQTRNEFFTAHKDIDPVKYGRVVKACASEIANDPAMVNADKNTIFNAVAKLTRTTLKDMGITLAPAANPGAPGGRVVPRANGVAPGGRSGGDGNGQKGTANNPDAEIYARNR